jgi:hypothetical protein
MILYLTKATITIVDILICLTVKRKTGAKLAPVAQQIKLAISE